ncbi:MAG: aspartate kinase [Lentisphaerae bacterium]|nr:aspartate kinase [Lentisphaerota bacterium]
MKVCKFGGSSLADAKQILKVVKIITSDSQRRVVVVSAPGKRFDNDDKVTDLLIRCAKSAIDGRDYGDAVAAVVERFETIRSELDLDESQVNYVREELERRLNAKRDSAGGFEDSIKALGEEFSARFCAAIFEKKGFKAIYVDPLDAGMFLSSEFGNARLLPESEELLKAHLEPICKDSIVIFPGFFGYTRSGSVATFPRGGSDITGAILAAALKVDVYENFTDVNSVCPIDPRMVPGVNCGISEMTYREMRELSYSGFGIFHDEAVQPAVRAAVPINIRNTNNPDDPGTMIVPTRKTIAGRVIGIATSVGFGTLFVGKYLMNREVGFVARLLAMFAEEGISFELIPAGIDDVSVIVRDKDFCEPVRSRIIERVRTELEADEVHYESGLAIIMVVGEGMRTTIGSCLRVVRTLTGADINIEMMNQGASEISMMFGIRDNRLADAAKALYKEFFEVKQ